MNRLMLLSVPLLSLLAACGRAESSPPSAGPTASSWKASTPEEFFESMNAAAARKDLDIAWANGFTRASKENVTKKIQEMIENMKKNASMRDGVRKKYKLDQDPASMSAEDLIKAIRRFLNEEDPEECTFLSSEVDGEKATIRVKEKKLKSGAEKEKAWKMEKEDGMWKRVLDPA